MFLTPALKTSDYVELMGRLVPNLSSHQAPLSPNHPGLHAESVPSLKYILHDDGRRAIPGMISFAELVAKVDLERPTINYEQPNDANECINIQFTSGTTGRPKAAALTHRKCVLLFPLPLRN